MNHYAEGMLDGRYSLNIFDDLSYLQYRGLIYRILLLNTPQLCCGDENSLAEGENMWYTYWL